MAVQGRRFAVVAALVGACAVLVVSAPAAIAAAPTVTINQGAGQGDPTATTPVAFTASFSQPVSGFDGNDVVLSGTAPSATAVVSGGPSIYEVDVSGMTASGTVIASIPAGAAVNASSQASAASTSTDHTVTFQHPTPPVPSVTINQGAGQADPTANTPIAFTASFSEPVAGFDGADVVVSGTAHPITAVVTGGPSIYEVDVSGMTTSGTVIASIPAGAAHDSGSTSSTASTSTDNTVTWNPAITPTPKPAPTPKPTPTPMPSTPTPTASQPLNTIGTTPGGTLIPVLQVPAPTPVLLLTPACTAHIPCKTTASGKSLTLNASCSIAAPCVGAVTLTVATAATKHAKARTTTLGRLALTLKAGSATALRVPLSAPARVLLRKHKRVALTLTTTLGSATTTRTITIGLPPAKPKSKR